MTMRLFSTMFVMVTLSSHQEDFSERARTLVDPYPDHRSVFVVDNILSEDACQRLIAASSQRDSFWAGDDPHEDARPLGMRTRARLRVRSWRLESTSGSRRIYRRRPSPFPRPNIWRLEESGVPAH